MFKRRKNELVLFCSSRVECLSCVVEWTATKGGLDKMRVVMNDQPPRLVKYVAPVQRIPYPFIIH